MSSKSPAKPKSGKTPKTTAKGLSLHIGLNAVNPNAYGGWSGPLNACEFDANDMEAIAKSRGLKSTKLLTTKATRSAVLKALRSAAKTLVKGDYFLLTYSGHGGQMPDTSGDEPDKKDETWCLYDGQLIDDELYAELAGFASGVRVLVLSDSCHSGTVTREAPVPGATPEARPKWMPWAVAARAYEQNRAFYDDIQQRLAKTHGTLVDPDTALAAVASSGRLAAIVRQFRASVVLISGCQDNQTSMDGAHNGAFTERLLRVWNHGAFTGNHGRFHQLIVAGMPATQTPNLFTLGGVSTFLAQRPFTV